MTTSTDALLSAARSEGPGTTQDRAAEATPTSPSMDASMERLAHALDEVRRLCPDLPVLAIHWMHLNHPIQVLQHEWLQDIRGGRTSATPVHKEGGRLRTIGIIIWRFGICWLYAAYFAVRLAWWQWRLRREISALKRQSFDVIAKTWRFGAAALSDGRDFYYGDLQDQLARKGATMLLLCGDATAGDWRAFARAQASTAKYWLPEWCLVPVLAPVQMAAAQALTCARLLWLRHRINDPLVRRVIGQASRDCLSRRIVPFGLYYWIGKTATATWHPKAFVTLYEGRGWELCLRRGVKAVDPSCQTVGYQHTIVLRHQRALLDQVGEAAAYTRPDVVLCLGLRTQAMLKAAHSCSTLIPFGTFRRFPRRQHDTGPAPEKRTVLIVPEGYLEEEILLFNSALRAARMLPDHRFVFRCHPVLPFEQVRHQLESDPGIFPNVEVSRRPSINEDFARASVVLYRGSSSVLYAVLHGVKPVYLHDERCHEVDPLFEMTGWRERASSAQEFSEVLQRYARTPAQDASTVWHEAVRYVEGYTISVTDAAIGQWLKTLGMDHHKTAR